MLNVFLALPCLHPIHHAANEKASMITGGCLAVIATD
jgi:hypothetical protein